MSSPASATALYLEPRPSRRLLRLLQLGYLATALLPWLTPLHGIGALALLPLLLLSYRRQRRHCMARVCIARESDGCWLWQEGEGPVLPVHLLPDTLLAPWLVLLNVQEEGGRRHSLLLLGDSLPAEQFRALRVALRLERMGTAQPAG